MNENKVQLKIRFDTFDKVKYAPIDIELDGELYDYNVPEAVAKGYVTLETEKGGHIIKLRQNNLYNNPSTSLGVRMLSRIVDVKQRNGEESPYYVESEIKFDISDNSRFDVKFEPDLDEIKKSGFIKYNFKIKTEGAVEYEIVSEVCKADEYSKKRWMMLNLFSTFLGFVIGAVFLVIGILSFSDIRMAVFAVISLILAAAVLGLSLFTLISVIRRYKSK